MIEEIDGALLEHARAHALLDVLARAAFEDDGVDAFAMQQVRQHEAGGARTDDADFRAPLLRHAAVCFACPPRNRRLRSGRAGAPRRAVEREAPISSTSARLRT
jgi:hypothetical protein